MPGKPIKIGPFTGGLNNMSTAGESKDNELIELVNLEVSKDESLTSRPPLTVVPSTAKYFAAGNESMGWEILGIYRVSNTEWYLIAMSGTSEASASDFIIKAYLNGVIGPGESAITVKTIAGVVNKVTGMAQFKDELFFIVGPQATARSFSWKKGTIAVDRSLPKGNVLISWKTRLWVSGTLSGANADRIWFSYVGETGPEPTRWEANDFFDVAPGEGGYITALIPSFNNLIVFKNDGTWRFSFPSSPKQGTIDKISGQVGASGKNAAVEFENFIYVYDQGYVYELVNSNFAQLNGFVKFKEDPKAIDGIAPGVELSIVNRRLIVRYFNAFYVFTVDTKSWSLWRSYNGIPGRFQELPVNSDRSEASIYIAPSRGTYQNLTFNLIQNGPITAELLPNTRQYFNGGKDEAYFDLPVTPFQKYELKFKAGTIDANAGVDIKFQKNDGSVETLNYKFTSLAERIETVSIPENSVMAQFSVYTGAMSTSISGLAFSRKYALSPSMLLMTKDVYEDVTTPVEYIETEILTKTYDYQAASSFKRLFYWGADLVTPRPIYAEARPVGRKNSITWGDLEAYSHAELEKGTWANPLSWLNRSTAEVSMSTENVDVSENGRFYIKLRKSLRFRQIAFYLKLTSLGNKSTGPVKIFGLTTLVNPKKDTIDTAT